MSNENSSGDNKATNSAENPNLTEQNRNMDEFASDPEEPENADDRIRTQYYQGFNEYDLSTIGAEEEVSFYAKFGFEMCGNAKFLAIFSENI